MLQINNISFGYERPVFRFASQAFQANEITQIHGKNGVGKTTLFRIIGGVLVPESGSIQWSGSLLDRRRTRVVYLGTYTHSIFPRLTGAENLEFFGAIYGYAPKKILGQAKEVDPFGLDFWNQPVETLSQGMLQKLLWVRALSLLPDILLLDEAMNAMDASSKATAMEHLQEFSKQKRVVLMAQHDQRVGHTQLELKEGGVFEHF